MMCLHLAWSPFGIKQRRLYLVRLMIVIACKCCLVELDQVGWGMITAIMLSIRCYLWELQYVRYESLSQTCILASCCWNVLRGNSCLASLKHPSRKVNICVVVHVCMHACLHAFTCIQFKLWSHIVIGSCWTSSGLKPPWWYHAAWGGLYNRMSASR